MEKKHRDRSNYKIDCKKQIDERDVEKHERNEVRDKPTYEDQCSEVSFVSLSPR